ncbi:neuroligin-4, X-linked [Cryptotermes secundus]|uniref:neuroligin-4, X-linked n=1 Tax=Cryptotermes secundus TaxID=105785 RepID=UPI000CD7B29C|nr:neuroligin-4, X-linked [Cryptotermes secundus]XP_033610323.1 neuroligin-4, X-linked [Cryptotermes secundus]XP_033610325.1 neuroligin-4, X-linked [Cryptotermes secundus]
MRSTQCLYSTRTSAAPRETTLLLLTAVALLARVTLAGPRYSSRIVETKTGAIRGIILELNSRHLEPVEAFKGVPYAAPPVGDLRYRPPAPPLVWSGTRLADTFGAVCPQRYPDISNRSAALLTMPRGRYHHLKRLIPLLANQSEDCLFLNLYVPGSGNRGLEAPYAVMVYIHGESYEWNSGNPYDGSVLASYGHVIVVTLNFRLGVLGFLRTHPGPDREGATGGNLGLRDILAALQWVRRNVAAFGGDPNRVTVLGHDTGAALVNLLLISSAAKGLFHRVVMLSGSVLSPWALVQQPDTLRETVLKQMGCHSSADKEDSAPCLRTKPLSALLDIQLDTPRFLPRFGPSIPHDADTSEPILTMEHANEAFINCELMLGATTTESYLDFNAADIQYGFEEDQRNRVLRTYIRNAYVYHLNEIFSTVRNEYTDWDKPIQHPINIRDSTMEALSDGHTVSPLVRVGYLHARRGAKTYFFHFGYQTKESDYPQRLGSVRGEDVTYILGMPLVGGQPFFPQNYSRQDMGVAEAVLNFFTNFAKTGDPNEPRVQKTDYGTVKEKTRYRGLSWETYETGSQLYLSIALKPKIKSHYRGHKMAVWLNLIPQLHQPGDEDVSMRHHHFHERGEHYYSGVVRPESYTRLPPPLHPATSAGPHNPSGSALGTECLPNSTSEEDLMRRSEEEDDDDEAGLLQRLATRHYYSYTAALGVTIGVGCLLLVLNMLIFAGIYYQRDRDRRRHSTPSGSSSSASSEGIPLSHRPQQSQSTSDTSSPAPTAHIIKVHEPPPSYTTVAKSPSIPEPPPPPRQSAPQGSEAPSSTPVPPVRSTSTSSGGTVKKRVQIQEISV